MKGYKLEVILLSLVIALVSLITGAIILSMFALPMAGAVEAVPAHEEAHVDGQINIIVTQVAETLPISTSNVPVADVEILAKTLYGEARGIPNTAQKAGVVWCILNRVDDPRWPDTIEGVCIPGQFAYNNGNPVDPELYDICLDVYQRWEREHQGETDVGRVLPSEYVFFHGDGQENFFRTEFRPIANFWDWSLPNPYNNEEETNEI